MSLSGDEIERVLKLSEKLSDEFDHEEAEKFSQGHKDKDWYEDFTLLLKMIMDSEFSISPGTWATIAGALAYVVFPLDIIPDFIPAVGWLDDVFVLAWVMKKLSDEIVAYKVFCRNRVTPKMLTASK